jgi:hypothetical protein
MTDRLSLANALADAKIDRAAAERIATEIFDAIHDSVATKSDLQIVRGEITAVRTELKADLQAVEAALKTDLRAVETALRAEMALLEYRMLTRLGSLIVVVAGLLFAGLRYLPPAH